MMFIPEDYLMLILPAADIVDAVLRLQAMDQ